MEQRARIVSNDKITHLVEDVRKGLDSALNYMLQTGLSKIEIGKFDHYMIPMETFLVDYKKKSVIVKIFSENDFQGELYWFFDVKAAIIFGALMRMIPLGAVTEKLKNDIYDASDQDSFGEVGNQLSGILDRAFRNMTSRDIHLRMDFNKMVYPSENITLSTFLNREEYVALTANIIMQRGYAPQEMTLLLPRSLVQVMLNIELELESFTAKKVLVHSWNPNLREKIQADMNSRYTKIIPIENANDIIDKLEMEDIAALGIGLKKLRFPLAHEDHIFLKRLGTKLAASHIPYFLAWENPTDEGLKELGRLGLTQATKGSIALDFCKWADSVTKDPTRDKNYKPF